MSLSFQPLSPLDSRYASQVEALSVFLSEAGLNRARIHVEIEWIIFLANRELIAPSLYINDDQAAKLRSVVSNFSDVDVAKLAETEKITRHDVKAVEYFVREKLTELDRADLLELTHFACTSEDINNLSYAITVRDAVTEVWLPKAKAVVASLEAMANKYSKVSMLSRTHGQPATPTTMGKEIAVFVHRLTRQLARIEGAEYLGKYSGATGTFSAHTVAAPTVDWQQESKAFVESLGLSYNPLTTQIESHDWQAELYSAVSHFGRILHNLATDIWSYISLGYFKQIPVPGATGSSTMPHKINPIRFENAEANLEISAALFDSLSATLVTSRLQRDLTDSSAQRNIGVAFGHSLLALDNLHKGLGEIEISEGIIAADLADNWEVLGEAIQTVIRAEVVRGNSSIANPYELLKDLTRGKRLTREDLVAFVLELEISQEAKDRLLTLTPKDYIGLAAKLAESS
ncbi:MAG: adenylosuccinate lyase [Actinomycetota bacterium]